MLMQETHLQLPAFPAITPPSISPTLLFPTERVCTTVLGL